MKRIQNPEAGQQLSRAFQLQGRVEPQLDEVIVPTIRIGDLSGGQPPAVIRAATVYAFQAAVAGEQCTARLEVPGNVLAIIDRIYVQGNVAANVRIRTVGVGGPQANTVIPQLTDGRLAEAGYAAAGVLTYGTQVASITTQGYFRAQPEGTSYEPRHLVIGSGRQGQFGFLEVQYAVVNQGFNLAIDFREYSII